MAKDKSEHHQMKDYVNALEKGKGKSMSDDRIYCDSEIGNYSVNNLSEKKGDADARLKHEKEKYKNKEY